MEHHKPHAQSLPPALTMALSGLHLIEASAGTGKTWALSALIVRFLIERRLEPRQIIATTFTRAAAAELQERIRLRILGISTLLHESLADLAQARQSAQDSKDLLGLYLLDRLSAAGRAEAYQHLKIALSTFDELFVGTLDSFCQKIWREFAFDIGGGESREISEETDALTEELIHDAIRRWRSAQAPFLIEQLVLSGRITDIEHHAGVAATALNFLGAEIAPIAEAHLDAAALEAWQAASADLAWQDWLSVWSGLVSGFYGGRKLAQHHLALPELVQWMRTTTLADLLALDDAAPVAQLLSVFADDKFSTNFKKDAFASVQVRTLLASRVSDEVRAFVQIRQDLVAVLAQAKRHLHYTIALYVREQLPLRLAAHAETTFSTQMHGLADALWRDSSALLTEQIRYRYPVALVDEFQDTNRDQDRVIERIYRQPWLSADRPQSVTDMPCLVLVGDPKQAIYGFRGGDVHTYLSARAQVAARGQIHALDQNQRSVVPLVQGVNAFFRLNTTLGDGVDYPEVSPADRGHAPLMDYGRENPYPLRFVQLAAKSDDQPASDEISQTVWRIMQLLQDSADGHMTLDGRALLPEDIAVLASSHRDLDAVEAGLRLADIPVWRQSRVNVFQSVLSHDLAALLQLMLSPYREDYLRRALAGRLIGTGLMTLDQESQDASALAEQQAIFAQDALVWQRYGFLSAWQRIAVRYQVFERLSRAEGEAMLAERSLVNLRHLIELLHRQSERRMGPHHLLAWLLRQIATPSDRGDEIERPLPSVSGVQLMTIHASKGLEFPIVFMLGLPERASQGSPKAAETILYLQDQVRMMSFDDQDEAKRAQHVEREAGEERRLLYVAATRAKYRQYLYLKAPKKDTPASFAHWLPEGVAALTQAMPDRVCAEDSLKVAVDFRYRPIHASSPTTLVARTAGARYYAGWGMTSFSALIRDVGHGAGPVMSLSDQEVGDAEVALGEPVPLADDGDAADEFEPVLDEVIAIRASHEVALVMPEPPVDLDSDTRDIRFRFERGANGGNCLHKILEYLDPRFDAARISVWTETFARQMQHHGIQGAEPLEMVSWFQDIMQAPISGGTTLAGLRFQSRVREFEFHLSLADERVDGPRILNRLRQAGIIVPELPMAQAVRYLKGFADLVYEHDGRFYVADYKSNYLGDQLSDYHQQAMVISMNESGYWLQACIYLVALHRYLKSRKADYQIEQHLGGACYLYLRGMQADSHLTGVVHWMPSPELILDMDAILGQSRGGYDAA